MARSRGEESEMNNAFDQKTPPPRAASTMNHRMDDDGDVLTARPPPLVEVRPQKQVQWHIAEQIIETFVPVQVLDAPAPQMGNQVVEVLQKIDMVTPEQVLAVPKISLDRIPQRSAVRRTQNVEQLVVVPTIVSFSSLQQRTVEQIIDTSVPHRRRRGQGGLQGFSSRFVEQKVDIPVPGGGLHVLPDPGGSSSSAVSRGERGEGDFSDFSPGQKKVRSPSPVRVRGCPPGRAHGLRRLMRWVRPRTTTTSTPSTTAPCGSRLGTTSTSVTVGAKSAVTMASASCRCIVFFGSYSRCHSDLEPPRNMVMAL